MTSIAPTDIGTESIPPTHKTQGWYDWAVSTAAKVVDPFGLVRSRQPTAFDKTTARDLTSKASETEVAETAVTEVSKPATTTATSWFGGRYNPLNLLTGGTKDTKGEGERIPLCPTEQSGASTKRRKPKRRGDGETSYLSTETMQRITDFLKSAISTQAFSGLVSTSSELVSTSSEFVTKIEDLCRIIHQNGFRQGLKSAKRARGKRVKRARGKRVKMARGKRVPLPKSRTGTNLSTETTDDSNGTVTNTNVDASAPAETRRTITTGEARETVTNSSKNTEAVLSQLAGMLAANGKSGRVHTCSVPPSLQTD